MVENGIFFFKSKNDFQVAALEMKLVPDTMRYNIPSNS